MFEDKVTAAGIDLYKDVGGTDSSLYQQPKVGKTWELLSVKNTQCDPIRIKKECYLYEGGFQMNTPEVAALFCPKTRSEDQTGYKERIASAAYIPTFTKLITGLISTLYSEDLAVMEAVDHDVEQTAGDEFTPVLRDFYKLFETNCDAQHTSLHNFFRDRTTKALVHQCAHFGLDYPNDGGLPPINQLELEQRGLDKPYLYKIDPLTIYDWQMQKGSCTNYEWIKLVNCVSYQPTPFDPPLVKYEIKVWSLNAEGLAQWETYLTRAVKDEKDLKKKEVIAKVDEGVSKFKRIPIWCMYLDDGIAVGAKLAPMASEDFNRRTIENHSTNKGCITVPVIYKGDMLPPAVGGVGGVPNPVMFDDDRGKMPLAKVNANGILELGKYTEDRMEIVETEGKALAFLHKQQEDLDEKMHSVIHQMGQSLKQSRGGGSSGSGSARSAQSKQEDRRATEMLLSSIADEVHQIVKSIFECIAVSRGEDIVFEVKGLSTVQNEDRDVLLQEAVMLGTLQFPSLTQQKEHYYRVGTQLIEGCGEEVCRTVRAELEENLEEKWNNQNPLLSPEQQAGTQVGGPKQVPQPSVQQPKAQGPQPVQEPKVVGPSGQTAAPEGAHLQTGQHIDAQVVYDLLAEDYNDKDIQWVLNVPWMGPMEVPLTSIDFSNQSNWQASAEPDKVDKFADMISDEGFSKPIILVNNPANDNKMMVVDGHHRALAYQQNGQPVQAYVGQVGSNDGPWSKLHSKQVGSKQASIGKEASNQVDKSEKAKDGKTK